MQLTARIWPEAGGFVAECVELRVVSEGDTEKDALENLRELEEEEAARQKVESEKD